MAMKKQTMDPCKYVTWAFGALATVFMLIAMVLVFACGLKTFNLDHTEVATGQVFGKNTEVAGFKKLSIPEDYFVCDTQFVNETKSCNPGDGGSLACGGFQSSEMRQCLPSNRENDGEDNTNINPDDDRYGFLENGACASSKSMCRSDRLETSNDANPVKTCAAQPNNLASTHGVCTSMGEMAKANGEECYDKFECKSNKCARKDDQSLTDFKTYCRSYATTEYTITADQDECSTTVATSLKSSAVRSHHDTCQAGKNSCPDQEDGCLGQICRTHMQNLETDDRNRIANAMRDMQYRQNCGSYKAYSEASPYLGLGFNLLIMTFLIPIHTFSPAWFSKRHSGWVLAACVGTMVSIYLVHLDYFSKTWNIVSSMRDCSGTDSIDAAYHMNNMDHGICVSFSGDFEEADLKKYLGVTATNNPLAMEFLMLVGGFTAGIVMAIISLCMTVLIQMGSPCILSDELTEQPAAVKTKDANIVPQGVAASAVVGTATA